MDSAAVTFLKASMGPLVLRKVRPLRDRTNDEHGLCNVCGGTTTFTFNSWVIPKDVMAAFDPGPVRRAYERRESMFCACCVSNLRVREISQVLLDLYGDGSDSISELVQQERFRTLDLAEINTIGALGSLHKHLAHLPRLVLSEFRPQDPLGEVVNGVRNEDLCRLTYPDASFDLVLSSDTLEHVPDVLAALSETKRVLRPGGCHIFTVPIDASRPTSRTRARVTLNGGVEHLESPLYHGRGRGLLHLVPVGGDMLAFTDFGLDLMASLTGLGFEPQIYRDPGDDSGASWVFAASVPG